MNNHKSIHFIGIGGIGISSLAYLALKEGKKVTGSDGTRSALIDDLIEEGADIIIGHNAENVSEDTELVIFTEAIDKETNPEYLRAKEMGIPALSYFQALGQLSRTKKTIAVAGTHGKTTTTAMLGLALIRSGLDPTVIVGSKVKEFGGKNIYIGKGDLLVVEACEYRRSFLNLQPFGVVLLNCEAEHLDYYKDEKDYVSAFNALIESIPTDGFIVANMDDRNARKLVKNCAGKVIGADMEMAKKSDLKLNVLGEFNRLNALQAYKAACEIGADPDEVKWGLENFGGTWRRMEVKGKFNGATVIDDYGHHPTEVRETIKAVKKGYPDKNLIVVFQPHQYSRTYLLLDEFKKAFEFADELIVPDIYMARDSAEDMSKIDAEKFVKILNESGVKAEWGKGFENTLQILKNRVTKNDAVLVMGAGNIGNFAEKLCI